MVINSASPISVILLDLFYKQIMKPRGKWAVSMILFVW